MPKTFQSNTIVPNKGLMVEDDDDDDNARGINGGGADSAELRSQVDQLERKVDELQGQLREKDDALQRAQSAASRDPSIDNERSEWTALRSGLEAKLQEARELNENLQAELGRLRSEKQDSERMLREDLEIARRNEREVEKDMRAQLDDVRREGRELERDLRAQLAGAAVSGGGSRGRSASTSNGSSERYEALERELAEQKQTTEEVRRDAAQFLQEMRELSLQSTDAVEKEERLLDQVSALEREIREWKARYAKLKSQNRSLRASMLGLPGTNTDVTAVARDSMFSAPDGLIRDVHITSYQIAIDELLQLARRPESDMLIECMKQVVVAVRSISSDIESLGTPESSLDAGSVDSMKQQSLLRAKLSQAANNLITATKAHAAAAGLAPVSLVDAAASNLTTVVMDLVRTVKVKPTPADELESPDSDRDKALPVPPSRGVTPTFNSLQTRANGVNGHVRNQSSVGSGYSAYSRYSRYSNNMSPARESSERSNGLSVQNGPGMDSLRESSLEEFKNFLDDSTALLVRSIQPLVSTVRSGAVDDQTINEYIRDISMTVEDITDKTNAAVLESGNPALKKHAPPVIKVLEKSRIELNQERNSKDKLPPVAFRIARATKVRLN
jgi:predicted  nucleic acid-binding Zn-ribbon protein